MPSSNNMQRMRKSVISEKKQDSTPNAQKRLFPSECCKVLLGWKPPNLCSDNTLRTQLNQDPERVSYQAKVITPNIPYHHLSILTSFDSTC